MPREGREFESPMQLGTEKPNITAKNHLTVGPGEYPCGNNLYLIVTPSGGRRWAFRYQRNGVVFHYLKAIKAAGTDEARAVVAQMKKMPIDDFYTHGATVREDGRVIRDMYVMQTKKPEESKYKYDYYKLLSVIAGKDAFRSIEEGSCPFVKSAHND